MDPIASHRSFFADLITSNAGVRRSAPALVNAFNITPRERFVGDGPWKVYTPQGYIETPSADPALVYQDIVIALDESKGINNGQPTLHALCIGTLQVKPGDVVLHVGAGTGYYTAILSEITGSSGHVHGYEIDAVLAKRAQRNLRSFRNVSIHSQSAAEGTLPDSDVIYVNAGATGPLDIWLNSLHQGGRLLFPLTKADGKGGMLLITKTIEGKFDARFILAAMFIPCIGARDDEVAARLSEAFGRGDHGQVRSLHRNTESDASSWCRGRNWWLSKDAG